MGIFDRTERRALSPVIEAAYKADKRTAMAQALQQAGLDSSPAATPFVGLSRILQAGLGAYKESGIKKEYASRDEARQKALAAFLDTAKSGTPDYSVLAANPDLADSATEYQIKDYQTKQAATAQMEQDAAKQAAQDHREELRQAAQDARAAAAEEGRNSRLGQQLSAQADMLDARLAASERLAEQRAQNQGSGGNPYFVPVQTSTGLQVFDARTGTYKPMNSVDGKPLLPNSVDPTVQGTVAGAKAEASAIGEAKGKAQGQYERQAINAQPNLDTLNEAEKLLPKATGGGLQQARDAVAGQFNIATEGSKAASQLDILAAKLTMQVPRMEGPQSDRDTALYKEAAGNLANRSLPTETRQAALERMKALNQKYAGQNSAPAGGVVRWGRDATGKPIRLP